jgi:hypothetical protein
MSNDSTICDACGKLKDKIPCKACGGFWATIRGYCKRCDDRGYFLVCPDQKQHNEDAERRELEREISIIAKRYEREERARRREEQARRRVDKYKPKPKACFKCGGTGYINGKKAVPMYKYLPGPPYSYVDTREPCPYCNSRYALK